MLSIAVLTMPIATPWHGKPQHGNHSSGVLFALRRSLQIAAHLLVGVGLGGEKHRSDPKQGSECVQSDDRVNANL
jgi:hypothetical protein